MPAEIFAPCAASRLITQAQVDAMINSGLEVVSCGAMCHLQIRKYFWAYYGIYR